MRKEYIAFPKFIANNFHNGYKKFPEDKFIPLSSPLSKQYPLTRCRDRRFAWSLLWIIRHPFGNHPLRHFEIGLDTVGVKQMVDQVTLTRMGFVLLSLRLLEISNSRGGLSFAKLRQRTWDASLRLRVPERSLKIALQGALFILRDSRKQQIALYVRVCYAFAANHCAFAHASEAKFVVPFFQEEYVCRERGESRKHKRVVTKSHFL